MKHTFLIIESLIAFAVGVWASINELERGFVLLSFVIILLAIYILFLAYEALRDSLTKKLKASQ